MASSSVTSLGPGTAPSPGRAATPSPGRESANGRGPGTLRTARLLFGLKARLTWAVLTRSIAVIVGVALGGLWGLFMMSLAGIALVSVPGILPPEGVRATAILVAAGGTVLWWVFAIVSGRADATLHASQFAVFPLPRRGIATGQILGALVGIAGPLTLVALIVHAFVWRQDAAALVTALLLGPVGWFFMVLGNRCLTALAERISAKRRVGDAITLIFLVLLMLTGPILTGLFAGVDSLGERLYSIADVVGWTPVGALWAVPADVAAGNWLAAAARLAVVVLTVGLLLWAWDAALRRSLEQATGAVNSGGGRNRIKGAGLFDRLPAKPWAAVTARTLTYWLKDPRYSGSLVIIPVMFVLFWFSSMNGANLLIFAGPFVGFLMAYAISADVAYDHKAFALHLLTGVPGWADRLGRVIGMLLPGVPLTALGVALSAIFTDRLDLLPALVGVATMSLLGGAGLSSVVSARYTYPVPLPGQSPFKTPQGFTVLNVLVQFVVFAVMVVMALPVVVLLIVQMVTGAPGWGFAALAVGVVLGPLLCAGGVWFGGKWLDARGPELLATVSTYR
ncbi:hypothetical protein GWK18_02960 [Kocuria sp. JC486]|uniref:hypothetical protein n=1 Tax=Kocuria sp. JC486 TaxID=1970736 RepID=UPI0014216907|nr:hypothetical protein [Kocuria sp. JC486]NHU84566.1 hypothetical protein [Kocuria sp. JC486]